MTEDFDERRLVGQVIAGLPGAVEEFVKRYATVVVGVLRRFRMGQHDRDDCWQTVFLRLLENDKSRLRAWRGGSLTGYITVIARHVAIDWLRTKKREVPLLPGFDRPCGPGGDPPTLPPEAIIRQVAKTCLTARHLEIYERYCRGEKAKQTGKALKMEANHVYVERNRMIRALRDCLQQLGIGPL